MMLVHLSDLSDLSDTQIGTSSDPRRAWKSHAAFAAACGPQGQEATT